MKKISLFFFAACFLIIYTVGSLRIFNLRLNGVPAEGRIVEINRFHPYSPANRLTPDKFEVKIQFQNKQGNFQMLNVRLSQEEQRRFKAALGTPLSFFYVPQTLQYSIGPELPSWTEWILASALLIPAALLCLFLALKPCRP